MPTSPPGRPRSDQLPSELTNFVGRRRERGEIKRLLGGSRLVTLAGPGGVGKTRLAVRVAAEVRRSFPDGVCLAELAQLRDPSLVSHALAAAVGFQGAADRLELDALSRYLGEKRLLVVLDNCEHLMETCAEVVDGLLRSCADLRVLVTSREPLHLDGECVYTVAPLPVDSSAGASDAVDLFLDRARSVDPDFELNADNRADVEEICRWLDGVPLAIELAATKTRALPPAEILEYFRKRRQVLRHDGRRVPERHGTLHACVDWSFELCSPAEQRLWTHLSVFAGGFEIDAAEGICADEALLDLILSLADKSILVREPGGLRARFRLLEMIREYGQEKFGERGRWDALRRRHRDWYVRLAARAEADWVGSRQPAWMSRLSRDHANLQLALDFCVTVPGEADTGLRLAASLNYYWRGGLLTEGREWINRLLGCPGASADARLAALHTGCWLAVVQGDLAAAGTLLGEAESLVPEAIGLDAVALVTQLSGLVAFYEGRDADAVGPLEQALDRFRASGDLNRQLETLRFLVLTSAVGPDPAGAAVHYDELIETVRPRGDSWVSSYAAWAYGIAAWRAGESERALDLARDSLRLKRGLPDTLGFALAFDALAWIEAARGEHERSAVLLGVAGRLWTPLSTSTVALPALSRLRGQCESAVRRSLGERAYESATARGDAMTLQEACDYGCGDGQATAHAPAGRDTVLTKREREVAELLAQGLSNKEIAAALVISTRTAETHVQQILHKLGLSSRAMVAARLARSG